MVALKREIGRGGPYKAQSGELMESLPNLARMAARP
jgi:hypothetical protein